MDMRFDQFGGELPVTDTLNWAGLSARLVAAHAIRRAMAANASQRPTVSGSFAPAFATGVAAYLATARDARSGNSSSGVNQDVKADGKSPGTIAADSTGKRPVAVRGPP